MGCCGRATPSPTAVLVCIKLCATTRLATRGGEGRGGLAHLIACRSTSADAATAFGILFASPLRSASCRKARELRAVKCDATVFVSNTIHAGRLFLARRHQSYHDCLGRVELDEKHESVRRALGGLRAGSETLGNEVPADRGSGPAPESVESV